MDAGSPPLLTVRAAARAIRDELDRGDTDFALRLVGRMLADLDDVADPTDLEDFLAAPPSTGDHRWDTLLAASIGRACRRRGLAVPTWTNVPPLRRFWFPDDDPLLTARTMQRTPIDLRNKGIWLDARALETA